MKQFIADTVNGFKTFKWSLRKTEPCRWLIFMLMTYALIGIAEMIFGIKYGILLLPFGAVVCFNFNGWANRQYPNCAKESERQ